MDHIYEKGIDIYSFPKPEFLYCGRAIYKTGHSYGPYVKDSYLIVFVERGKSILYANKNQYPIEENDLLVFYPNSKIHYENIENTQWHIWWMGICGEGIDTFFESIGLESGKPFIKIKAQKEILEIFNEMNESINTNSIGSKMLAQSLVYKFFSLLLDDSEASNVHIVQEITNYINYHYDTIRNISELYDVFLMSKNNMWRLFKKETGRSPMQYITDVRCRRAADLLLKTDFSIKIIANSVGYDDALYFSRHFKKKMGMSPKDFRKKKSNE